MQLAHRNYYQVSTFRHDVPAMLEDTCLPSHVLHPVDQLQSTLNHRVASLSSLLATFRPVTPLLNALFGVVFFIKDTDARYVLANLTLAQRCGYDTVAPLLGHTSVDVFPDHLGPVYRDQDLSVVARGMPLLDELELHLYSGRAPGWCLTHKLPIRDYEGRIVGVAGISHDLPSGQTDHPAYEKIARVETYIGEHYGELITLEELTAVAGLSVSQLERYCKRIYRLTPRQMIHKARIEKASRMLTESDASITDIALTCGYSDHSAFSRQFKVLTGITPNQFRQSARAT